MLYFTSGIPWNCRMSVSGPKSTLVRPVVFYDFERWLYTMENELRPAGMKMKMLT